MNGGTEDEREPQIYSSKTYHEAQEVPHVALQNCLVILHNISVHNIVM